MRLKVLLMISLLAVALLTATAVPAFALSFGSSSSCAVAGGTAACANASSSCAVAGGTVACGVANFFDGLFGFLFNPFGLFF
jgi:hypothetical protein